MKKTLFFTVFCLLITASAYAGQIQISTYYPSPFGYYERLKFNPRTSLTEPCEPGTVYYLSGTGLKYCAEDTTWKSMGGGVWTQAVNNIYPADTATNPNLRVGIGTTSPASSLHVYAPQGDAPPGVFLDDADISVDGGADGIFGLRNMSASGTRKITMGGPGLGTEVMTIDAQNSRVGIGTTAPQAILHVERNQNSDTDFVIRNTTAGSDSLARFRASGSIGNGEGLFTYYDAGYTVGGRTHFADRAEVRADSGTTGLSLTASAPTGDIRFYTGGDTTSREGMRITDTGNIGIGTTNPGNYSIVVKKTEDSSLALVADSDNNNNGDNPLIVMTQDGGGNAFLIGMTGTAGTDPLESLYTGTTQNAMFVGDPGGGGPTGNLQFGTNNAVRMTIDGSNGNIGIGTTVPSTPLEVTSGAIKASGGFILETRITNPATPVAGQMWLCVDNFDATPCNGI